MGRYRKKELDNRVCAKCRTNKVFTRTYKRKDGTITTYQHWHKISNGIYWCQPCYNKEISAGNQQFNYKGQRFYDKRVNRIGVCHWCRTKIGEINPNTGKLCKTTHLHHEQYDDKDKLKHTIEICDSCHGALNKGKCRPRKINSNKLKPTFEDIMAYIQ